MRGGVRAGLTIAAVLCFVAFLTYQVTVERTAAGGEVRRHTVGLTFSPWFVRTIEEGPGGRSEATRITSWSLSWLVLAAGAALWGAREGLGPKAAPPGAAAGATP